MTTIRARTAHLAGVIRRILDGTRPPDRFLLHISPDPAGLDDGMQPSDLPSEVRALDAEVLDHVDLRFIAPANPFSGQLLTTAPGLALTLGSDASLDVGSLLTVGGGTFRNAGAVAVRPGGTLLYVTHHPFDLEVAGLRPHLPEMFATGEQMAESLDPATWTITTAAPDRPGKDADGNPVTLHDAVLRATRRTS